jgi:hypothetical protein
LTSKSDTQKKNFIEEVAKKIGAPFDQVAACVEQYRRLWQGL